jgi:hypothetical protein
MTAHSTIIRPNSISTDADRTPAEVRGQARTDLRQRIEMLLREIFEGHEGFLGCTPD